MLGEELGELLKAIRAHENIGIDNHSNVGVIEEEFADLLIYGCTIANRLNINLDIVLREKEGKNQFRKRFENFEVYYPEER